MGTHTNVHDMCPHRVNSASAGHNKCPCGVFQKGDVWEKRKNDGKTSTAQERNKTSEWARIQTRRAYRCVERCTDRGHAINSASAKWPNVCKRQIEARSRGCSAHPRNRIESVQRAFCRVPQRQSCVRAAIRGADHMRSQYRLERQPTKQKNGKR
jgi:hypothetical protein